MFPFKKINYGYSDTKKKIFQFLSSNPSKRERESYIHGIIGIITPKDSIRPSMAET